MIGQLDDGAKILKLELLCRCAEVVKVFNPLGPWPDVHCGCGQVHRIDWPVVTAGISFAKAPATSEASGPGAGGKS